MEDDAPTISQFHYADASFVGRLIEYLTSEGRERLRYGFEDHVGRRNQK